MKLGSLREEALKMAIKLCSYPQVDRNPSHFHARNTGEYFNESCFPQIYPVYWIALRRCDSTVDVWNSERYPQKIVYTMILKLEQGELSVRSRSELNGLIAYLYSLPVAAMVPQEDILAKLFQLAEKTVSLAF
jgi:hypothetical protein